LPKERAVITVRQHPSVLAPGLAAAVGGLLAAIAASRMYGGTGIPEVVVWTLAVFMILKFILNVASWPGEYIVITSERFLQITGFFVRKVNDMPLANLDEMTFQRSVAGRILGYGTFRLGPPSDGQQAIDYVPYPEQIYLELKGILSKNKEESEDH
jgi:uncharacterized membrane protein YdbT with pleckstrin-like domain